MSCTFLFDCWFGLTSNIYNHHCIEKIKKVCDKHNTNYYSKFKKWADDYFYINHRKETRGVGGIFFDRLNSDTESDSYRMSFEKNFAFWQDVGKAFAPIYVELIKRNKNKTFTEKNKQWQLLRRGRYVEFNLVYDKGNQVWFRNQWACRIYFNESAKNCRLWNMILKLQKFRKKKKL